VSVVLKMGENARGSVVFSRARAELLLPSTARWKGMVGGGSTFNENMR
jgi:hypothetical protein